MIHAEQTIQIDTPPASVFGVLADLSKTPQWNPRCVEVKQVSPGPFAAGAKLHYRFKEPGRQGEMDGEVIACEPSKTLAMRFVDKSMAVDVRFELQAQGSGTSVVHVIDVEPRSFMIKLMTPLLRGALRKQAVSELDKLKKLVEPAQR
jgi:uncharacterized protein YndB with AHSA1/START domain